MKHIVDTAKFIFGIAAFWGFFYFAGLLAALGWHEGTQVSELRRDARCVERTMQLLDEQKANGKHE